jgi:hypothetical protein
VSLASPVPGEFNLAVEEWCVWQAEAVPEATPWPAGRVLSGAPGLDFLPLLQRRRLSPLAKAALAVAWRCGGEDSELPAVFCSNHGESRAYFGMLEDLAAHRELSPSGFSLAVHNAIAGLYSQFSGNRSSLCVLAPGREGPFAAFLEAAGLLREGQTRVLIVCYEQPLPEAYQAYARGPAATLALALRVGLGIGPRLRLRRVPAERETGAESCPLETLVRSILAGDRRSRVAAGPALWEWSLDDA